MNFELLEQEVFKKIEIKGFENYFISNMGRCSNGKKILKSFLTTDGYERIPFGKKKFSVQRLVAQHFIGNPANEKMQVNHKNFKRNDNRAENLEWVTPKENIKYSIAAGNIDIERLKKQALHANKKACEKRKRKVLVMNESISFNQTFESLVECEKITGICRKALGAIARGERKSHKGYIAKYL